MKRIRVREIVGKAMDVLGVGLFTVIFFVVLLQIFLRYVADSPLTWSEELVRYVFVWISLLGWVYATRSGTHIRVSAMVGGMPVSLRRGVEIFNLLLTGAFSVILCVYGWGMMQKSQDVPTVTLFFSFAVIYAAVPLSGILILFYSFFELLALLKGNRA